MRGTLPPLSFSVVALVLANLVPLAGALLGWWSTYELLLLFWAENVVIGLFQVLRMGSAMVLRRDFAFLFLIPFFAVHYGMFAFVHGQFVAGVMAPPEQAGMERAVAFLLSPEGLLWALLALTASHAFSFVVNYLGGGEWRGVPAQAMMMQPYGRVVVLHLVIIAGGFAALALGEPIAALVLLVVLKIGVDIAAHRREHMKAAAGA